MNTLDPRHTAATAPVATPQAPQWGGQAPSVIDPALIAHLANAFFNAAPGQTPDPQAIANFAATQERPPVPPSSLPGAIGAGAAVPGTSVPGTFHDAPFITEITVAPIEAGRAPAQHIPAASQALGTKGLPSGPAMQSSGIPAMPPAPSALDASPLPVFAGGPDLSSLPGSLGAVTQLVRPGMPHEFPQAIPVQASPGDVLYFLEGVNSADAPAMPAALPNAVTAFPMGLASSHSPGQAAPRNASTTPPGLPGPQFDQSPTYGRNFPSEAELRPGDLSTLHELPPPTFPSGFTHEAVPAAPASAGEHHYFANEAESVGATQKALGANGIVPDAARLTPHLQPLLPPDQISGTRPFDAYTIKQDFPILHQQVHGKPLVWLDNAATTQKPQAVIDRLTLFYENENSNIHRAAHALAARSTDAYEAAREKVRRFLNAGSLNDIVFTRGSTEAINLVAQAWGRRNIREGDEIVITWLEHHANIVPWQMLCAETGACLRVAPVDDCGQILLDEYTKLMGPKTRMVSLPQVSNALGTITPAQEMVAIAHRHGACVLVDGAQAVSHMPVDVQALDCDFYVFSGHKVFGPTGIGVLYGKPAVLAAMPPWQGGGNMIADVTFEKTIYQPPPGRFEAGTGNIADAVGLGAAIDYVERIGMANISAYEHTLLTYATEGLCKVAGLKIIGTAKEKAGVISFVLDGCRSEDVGKALDREGIAVRAGHHCAQPILRRFGLETTVRPSLALYNTYEDIDALVLALHRIQQQKSYRGH